MAGYISKDFVHEGCGLVLDPDEVWKKVPHAVRKNIKKAERNGVEIVKVEGTPKDIDILRGMWYDPGDPNMPDRIREGEHMFIAFHEGKPVGAVILLPVGNHLFLNNLAGSPEGKELRVQDFLLWHCVNYFAGSGHKYIDVGVSYRPSLYTFFTKWKIFSYPVIFNVPEKRVDISLNPFDFTKYSPGADESRVSKSVEMLKELSGSDKMTFLPGPEWAEKVIRAHDAEPPDMTFDFGKIKTDKLYYIDLPKIFPVQFGAVVFNLELPDKRVWNEFMCLDVFKRAHVLTNIHDDLSEFDLLIAKRKENIRYLAKFFAQEDINPEIKEEKIPSAFYFRYPENNRYHTKLDDFGISHYFEEETLEIGLPAHQNLDRARLGYLYAIFRGVLNLCSEWAHTDKYEEYKGE